MRYLKLFEEARIRWYNKGKWVEEEIDPDIDKNLYLISDRSHDIVLIELKSGEYRTNLFNDTLKKFNEYYEFNIIPNELNNKKINIIGKDEYIWVCNYDRKYKDLHDHMKFHGNCWVVFEYNELPQDIKNRLNCKCDI